MTQFEDVLETILEEYTRRDSEGEFDTWEETDAFVKEKAEVLLAYIKEEPVSKEIGDYDHKAVMESLYPKLKEEHVSDELEEATNNYILNVRKGYPRIMDETDKYICNAFKAGAKWQKEQIKENIQSWLDGV